MIEPDLSFQPVIVSCHEHRQRLESTLSRFAATDWGSPPRVQLNRAFSGNRLARRTKNLRRALEWFSSQCDAEFLLLLDDNLEFNIHLRWNLERWSPLLDHRLDFGALCSSTVRSQAWSEDACLAKPDARSQNRACLLSRLAVEVLLRDADSVPVKPNPDIPRILSRAGYALFHHRPALAKPAGKKSLLRRSSRSAKAFASAWKCVFSHEQIPGWFTFPKLYSQAVAEARDGDLLIEVGAWLGRSTAFLAAQVQGCGKQLRVLVVDTFQGSTNEPHMVIYAKARGGTVRGLFERNMKLAGVAEVLEIREARSVDVARSIPNGSCSFVFIDADHRYEAVRADIRAWRSKVRPGGVLAGHDCYTYAEVLAAVKDELGNAFEMTQENVWIHRPPAAAT